MYSNSLLNGYVTLWQNTASISWEALLCYKPNKTLSSHLQIWSILIHSGCIFLTNEAQNINMTSYVLLVLRKYMYIN